MAQHEYKLHLSNAIAIPFHNKYANHYRAFQLIPPCTHFVHFDLTLLRGIIAILHCTIEKCTKNVQFLP